MTLADPRGAPREDDAARHAIRHDLDATLVVEAAAGTGKTTEMIARIIAVLRTGQTTLERIVAVTFTEKAAGEMKLRLRTELDRARQDARDVERARFEAALAELELARIGTIHAFCTELLRERPIEARVDPLFEVAAEDEAERLFGEAFDRWFQATLANPGEGVARILRRAQPVELLRKAGWSLVDRRDFDGAWRRDPFDRPAAIDGVLAELAGIAVLSTAAEYPGDRLGQLLTKLDHWLAELARREAVRGRDHDGLEAELAQIARWWEWRYSGRSKMYGQGLLRADVVVRRDAAKASLDAFLAAAEADLAACLHAELRPLVIGYERLKARNGRLDFLDLLARVRDLLRDDHVVRGQMQHRFTHFFVDEFQDTDPLQVDILMLLCAADRYTSDPATVRVAPGKLFVVGDPKQAIYRFRRADIALYEAVKQRLVEQGARLVHLTTSFRAVPAIQSVVNAAFAPVMRGNGQATYVPLSQHRDDFAGQPAVVALPVPKPYGKRDISNIAIQESYPDAVGAFLDHLVRGSGWTVPGRSGDRVPISARHVCLMFRRFQSYGEDLTRPYVRALEARSIPHVLVGGRSFHEREEIEAVRNALAAIEWPDDELSVYATLRGPFFAFHDEDLVAFQAAHARLHPLQWLDGEPADPVAAALAVLGRLHRRRNRRPIADTISRLLATTRAHAGLAVWPAGEQALANVLRVMDLARRYESAGASSFRAFVERLARDSDRGKQPDAPVVEEGTEGVRIMTVHAAKGLEFPVVILCDPTAPLGTERPSHYIDAARSVWLEPLAGCVPSELREHAEEILLRDREETERLSYVAVTRARDLLVVPVVGDAEREGWLQALNPTIHPAAATKRQPQRAPSCPAFGTDSVKLRLSDLLHLEQECVSPGLHVPRAGTHGVVWWDPEVLDLEKSIGGGMRQRQILQADESRENADASVAAHAVWQARHEGARAAGARPSLLVQSVTKAAKLIAAGDAPVTLADTGVDRTTRPRGKRFGTLVHAALAAVELGTDAGAIRIVVASQARLVGASREEIEAAAIAVQAALVHPLLLRAAAAPELRREVPIVLREQGMLIEGIVDLALGDRDGWLVVDFKSDAELDGKQLIYEAQVRLYARAIERAMRQPCRAALLIV